MRRNYERVKLLMAFVEPHGFLLSLLKGRDGDHINAVLATAGYNFSLLLRWFEELLRVLLLIIRRSRSPRLLLC